MIYLLRHGEIDNMPRRFVGQTDLPLTENGKAQAKRWRRLFSKVNFDFVYSSDLIRCVETSRIIAGKKREIIFSRDLREISMGEWEAYSSEDVQKQFPDEWEKREKNITGYRPPNGESFFDLRDRIVPAFLKIAALPAENILVVSHMGAIRTLLCHILGVSLEKIFVIGLDYAGLCLIDQKKNPIQVVSMNTHFL